MDNTVILILSSILLLFLILPLLFFLRRRVELKVEHNFLVLEYPLSTKKIDLEEELLSWNVQKSYYFRYGTFYAINMELKNRKGLHINSMLNEKNYRLLFEHLSTHFDNRKLKSQGN